MSPPPEHRPLEETEDDPDAPGPPIAVSESSGEGEGGKLRIIVTLLKKALGVKDIAAMRLSLPASLLEPVPNLEYWSYLDRPDLFAGINDSEDPFERLLAVMRFMFSKDIKFIHGKVCKPYNSVLGEFFLSHWDVIPVAYPEDDKAQPPIQHLYLLNPLPETVEPSSKPAKSPKSPKGGKDKSTNRSSLGLTEDKDKSKSSLAASNRSYSPSPSLSAVEKNLAAGLSDLSLIAPSERSLAEAGSVSSSPSIPEERLRVVFLTEQISHHPPISAYHYEVPSKGIRATGVDQIFARVSGATVKVGPGAKNKGIFIILDDGPGKGECYQISHPTASVNGILTGKLYATVAESSIITIKGGKNWRVVIEFKDEPWLGSPKFALEGCIHTVEEGSTVHESWTKVKHVPVDQIVARIEGCWKNEIRWKKPDDEEWKPLINVSNLAVFPKNVRPITDQYPNESRKLWEGVTSNLIKKEYGEATKIKHDIEQKQRDIAAARRKKGEVFVPVYFDSDIESGIPTLTPAGKAVLKNEEQRTQQ